MTIPKLWHDQKIRFSWEYRDQSGTYLGTVARYDGPDGKEIVPFFGSNGKAGAPADPRPLYGLDSLKNTDDVVYVVEGEKCAAALHSLGMQAVTSLGGSKAPHKPNWTPLQAFREIVLLPDNDEPGEKYMQDVAGILAGLPGSRTVKIARLLAFPVGGDVVDWIMGRVNGWDGFSPVPREPGDDLRVALVEAIEAVIEPVTAIEPVEEEWSTPIPLKAAALPAWPDKVFPEPVHGFVTALSKATESPVELAFMLALAVLATAVQGRFIVMVKSGYFEPLCLWVCVALLSGSRKTAVFKAVTRPLILFQKELRRMIEPERKRIEAERKVIEGRMSALRTKAAKANVREFDGIKAEILDLEDCLPAIPAIPTQLSNDVTPERVASLMSENEGCLSLLSDEGGLLDIMAGRYSQGMPNLDALLQGHAGAPISVERQSRQSIFIEHPALSIGISPQPDVVAKMNNTPEFRGRGLLARFLYALPESNLGMRTLESCPMRDDIRRDYENLVTSLLQKPWAKDSEGNNRPHVLTLDSSAYSEWHAFALRIEAGMRPGGMFQHLQDWASKLPGAVARIAGILHCVEYADERPSDYQIDVDTMNAAIALGEVLSQHALCAFDLMGADSAVDDARKIVDWVKREKITEFSRRDVLRGIRSFRRSSELDAPIEVLCERGYIRPKQSSTPIPPGRPSALFEVNKEVYQ
jgi:hypothetical protein